MVSHGGWVYTGFPGPMPPDVDFVYYSNEDIGFTANLVTGTNDVFGFALPYPSSMDLAEQSMVLHALDFIYNEQTGFQTSVNWLLAFVSMLQRDFTATYRGDGADTEDEALKAQLDGPLYFGNTQTDTTATAAVEGVGHIHNNSVCNRYFPPVPLDLLTPLYVQFVNQTAGITLATNARAAANFTQFEQVALRAWYTIRDLTGAEKAARATTVRFSRLDS